MKRERKRGCRGKVKGGRPVDVMRRGKGGLRAVDGLLFCREKSTEGVRKGDVCVSFEKIELVLVEGKGERDVRPLLSFLAKFELRFDDDRSCLFRDGFPPNTTSLHSRKD